MSTQYAVVSDHEAATEAGRRILASGGNAIDAAVAVSFALCVVRPEDCGLGGGGFAVYRGSGGEVKAFDFREQSPSGIKLEDYLDQDGNLRVDRTTLGAWSVCVPGQVRGALKIWELFGSKKLELEEVLRPAIELAREGFTVDKHLSREMTALAEKFRAKPEYRELYSATYEAFLKEGGFAYEAGDLLKRPRLAGTLENIAEKGYKPFYEGTIGQAIVKEMGRLGGPLSASDLAGYNMREVEPVRGEFFGYTLYGAPPPSSGGTVVLEVFQILKLAEHKRPALFRPHLVVEAMKHAFADRSKFLGDRTEVVLDSVPVLISERHASGILSAISPHKAVKIEQKKEDYGPNGSSTHFCVADSAGRAVSWTQSLSGSFGSLVAVPDTGILLNNAVSDFDISEERFYEESISGETPGGVHTSSSNSGVPAGEPNSLQINTNPLRPLSRPLCDVSPLIVCRPGGFVLTVGSSRGLEGIAAVVQFLVRTLLDGFSANAAVREGRYGPLPGSDLIFVEPAVPGGIVKGLLERGHILRTSRGTGAGCIQAIERVSGELHRVVDWRK